VPGTPSQVLTGRETAFFPASPDSVSAARTWLQVRAALLAPARIEDLMLVISELVTNAVRHGGGMGQVELSATPKDEFLCVQVTDDGPGFVPRPGAMGSDPSGGYGLFLVDRLARRWGMTREARRTRVWFEFDYAVSADRP
jgi:anti-sigma regulatory factor (Ser/Thr protein kinase)